MTRQIQIELSLPPQPDAKRQFQQFKVVRSLVEGIAPPLSVPLPVLAYLRGIVTVGMALGLELKRRWASSY